jgi:hypothetical protein
MRGVFLSAAGLLLFAGAGWAQTTTGSIVGTVTDSSGGIVPNAAVTVTNMDTSTVVKTVADAAGNFVLTPLLVGRYSVTVEANGFKKEVRPGVTVDVQSRVRVDFVLQVGAVTESVEVAAPNPLLETDTSYLGQVVDSQRVDDLPLNGRYLTRLAVLTTGTAPTTFAAKDSKTGAFSVNGVRPYQNNFMLDGMDNNNLSAGLTAGKDYVIGPSPDAVAEFRVQTNAMSAEFGHSAGGVMNVTIKSGTNELHGSAFEFLRNSALDAKNFFDSPLRPIPAYKQNQFGVTGGGPVVIPHLYDGRNKTFFFADFQGTRIRRGLTYLSTLPPTAWLSGDFSGFRAIYDPATTTNVNGVATRQPFPGNQVPAAQFDPVAKKLIPDFPAPNLAGTVSSSGVANNFLYNPSLQDDVNQFDVRIDHRFSDQDTFFFRFSFQNEPEISPSAIPLPLGDANFQNGDFTLQSRQAVATYTHIFNPRTINEFRVGYTYDLMQLLAFNAYVNEVGQLGIPGIQYSPGGGGLPAIFISGLSNVGGPRSQPTVSISNLFQFSDILSLVRGSHTLKIGAELRPRVNFSWEQPNDARGTYTFNGDATKDPNNLASTGLGTAAFLLGAMSQAVLSTAVSNDVFQQPAYAGFVQDDYKVTRKLTLNLGVRYDFVYHAMEKYNAQSHFNLSTHTLDIVKGRNDPLPTTFDFTDIPVNRNAPRSLVPNNFLNFAPRIGFAYNVMANTVIRGGYGIFWSGYEAGPLSSPNAGQDPPFYADSTFAELSVVSPNPNYSQLSQGFPANALSQPQSINILAIDPHFRNPYTQDWNVSVQREFGWNTVLDLSYAGSKGTGLYEFRNVNQPLATTNPTIPLNSRRPLPYLAQDLTEWCSCSSSTYHSLQTKLEKRFSSGLSFLAAYTFGKTIDETSQASLGIGSGSGFRDATRNPQWEKGLADFDVRHRFSFSYTYDLPFGHGKMFGANMNRAVDFLLGGWALVGIDSYQTGLPITITAANGVSNSNGQNRPDVVPGVSMIPANQGPSQWFTAAAFRTAVAGTYGNAGKNILEGPPQLNLDFSVFKNFRLAERRWLQFRSEFFNIINHPNFQGNGIQRSFDLAGAGTLTAANTSRQIQFALKLTF